MKMKFFVAFLVPAVCSAAFAPSRLHNGSITRGAPLYMGLLGRFRSKRKVNVPNPIAVGDALPEVDVQVVADGESTPMTIQEVVGDGTSILVGMPGAFTPTCSTTHLPGYVNCAPKLRDLGVKTIAVLTTNDEWVNTAWRKDLGIKDESESPLTMVSDGDGELVRQMGMVDDMGFGLGVRSKRFAMVVQDGKASHIEIDEGMDECTATSAQNLINILTPESDDEAVELDPKTLAIIGGGGLLLLFLLLGASGGGGGGGGGGEFGLLNTYN